MRRRFHLIRNRGCSPCGWSREMRGNPGSTEFGAFKNFLRPAAGRFHFFPAMIFVLMIAIPAGAGSIKIHSLVVRAGFDDSRLAERFGNCEASLLFHLPGQWQPGNGIEIALQWEVALGVLQGGGENALLALTGPRLSFLHSPSGLFLYLGVSPAYMSRETFGDVDFGGRFAFVSYVGAGFYLSPQWLIGYYFQHMSNAGVYAKNPGLNTHVFEISYLF